MKLGSHSTPATTYGEHSGVRVRAIPFNAHDQAGIFSGQNIIRPRIPPPPTTPPHRRLRGRSTVPVAQMKMEEMERMSARSLTMLGGSMHQSQRTREMSTGGRTMLKGPIYWSSRGFLFMSSGRNGHTTSARLWRKQWIRTDIHLPDLLID
jgi:hypothetical protein